MDTTTPRFDRERRTLSAMVGIFCRERHGQPDGLCPECRALLEYALARLEKCPFGAEKPKCAACTVHCYRGDFRARVRAVMAYAGPRMLKEHPVLAVRHLVDGIRHRPRAARPHAPASDTPVP